MTKTTRINFVRSILTDPDFVDVKVRDVKVARNARRIFRADVRELRTRKHTHLAVAFDVLGNATVLTADYRILQLVGTEADALPR